MLRFPRAVGVAGALMLAVPLVMGCATAGPAQVGPRQAAPAVTLEAELAALARLPVHDDPQLAEQLAGIVDRLATDQEREGAERITVVVVRDPTVGVFAMPPARIYVHSGLLAAVGNEAQLAAILAREVTHVRRGHAASAAGDAAVRIASALDAVAPSVSAALTRGDEGPLISPVAALILGARLPHAYTAAMSGHGAEREREADAGAFGRLLQAGYDPREAPRAFERLRRAANDGGTTERIFVAGDASVAERIATFTRLLQGASVWAPGAPMRDAPAFEASIIPLVRENARLEMQAGRFRAARAQLDRVIAVNPSDARAHLYDGHLHRLRAQRARSVADRDELARMALAAYQQCEALDPAVTEVSREIGLLYYQQGRLDQARAAFERYLAHRPDAPDAARVAEYVLALTR